MQSKFDGLPGIKLHDEPAQSAADAQAAFQQAVATAKRNDLVVMVLGEGGADGGRSGVELGAATRRTSAGIAGSGCGDRQTRGAGADQRTSAEHFVGGGARAGDCGGVGAG